MLKFLGVIVKVLVVLGFTALVIVFLNFKYYGGSTEGYIFLTEIALLIFFLISLLKAFLGWMNFTTRKPKIIAHEIGHAIVVERLLPGWLKEIEVTQNYFKNMFKSTYGTITYTVTEAKLDATTTAKLMAGYVAGIAAENFNGEEFLAPNEEMANIFLGYSDENIDKANFLGLANHINPGYTKNELDHYLFQAFDEARNILGENKEEFDLLKERLEKGSSKLTREEFLELLKQRNSK